MTDTPSSEDPAAQLEAGESGELVIAIVAPIGTDSKKVHRSVREVLTEFGYETTVHKLSDGFSDPRFANATGVAVARSPEYPRMKTAMDAGDMLRGNTGLKEILGIVAAGSIYKERVTRRKQAGVGAPPGPIAEREEATDEPREEDGGAAQVGVPGEGREQPDGSGGGEQSAPATAELDENASPSMGDESPLALDRVAHLIHSLKRPEEAIYLSRVYGGRFLLLSLYAPREERLRNLVHRGIPEPQAIELIVRDESGVGSPLPTEKWEFGQATGDTFHRADMFVDATRSDADTRNELRRFFDLVFGSPLVTPRKDEHAMFLAFAASLKSGDLSRQVGAVIATQEGLVLAEGANDAPGPFGVPYWPEGDDHRDIAQGWDSNERIKQLMVEKLREEFSRLVPTEPENSGVAATGEAHGLEDASRILEQILVGPWLRQTLKQAGFLDITEFGRAVHAEMAALMSCASTGIATRGLSLYCTTFPCHNCTKHLVAAGIKAVVFIEPYPKSRAVELHNDAISLTKERGKVEFRPFVGIGPKRYADLFVLRDVAGGGIDRKDRDGKVVSWSRRAQRPVLSDRIFTYIGREKRALGLMNQKIPKA